MEKKTQKRKKMKRKEKFDHFWYEEQFRVSLDDMKLYHIRDTECKKPFVVIGFNNKEMSFRRFKNKIRILARARSHLVSFNVSNFNKILEKWTKVLSGEFSISGYDF